VCREARSESHPTDCLKRKSSSGCPARPTLIITDLQNSSASKTETLNAARAGPANVLLGFVFVVGADKQSTLRSSTNEMPRCQSRRDATACGCTSSSTRTSLASSDPCSYAFDRVSRSLARGRVADAVCFRSVPALHCSVLKQRRSVVHCDHQFN
jgi:hypothetical protein